MTFLILSVLCTALLVIFFKIFEKMDVPVFQAIVFNYLSATACAFYFLPNKSFVTEGQFLNAPWLPFALMLGSLFIIVFNLTSITTIKYGVSTASLAMKLGLIFPVILAFVAYGESFSSLKFIGIALAFLAVVLTSIKDDGEKKGHHSSFAFLPLVVFFGSGLCDSLTQFANKYYVSNTGMEEFSFFLFVAAAVFGTAVLGFQLISKRVDFNIRSLVGGIALGIVNYFSFLFLLKSLATLSWGSSVIFPISNLGTVAVATIAGIAFFREKPSLINIIGLLCAFTSISIIIFDSV